MKNRSTIILDLNKVFCINQLATKENIGTLPDESKDLQVPSGLSIPSFMNCTEVLGLRSRLTPPTRAASQWPLRMAWNAFSKANKLEEQAVSMEVLGPAEAGKRKQMLKYVEQTELEGEHKMCLQMGN